jgi:hypothetical protein
MPRNSDSSSTPDEISSESAPDATATDLSSQEKAPDLSSPATGPVPEGVTPVESGTTASGIPASDPDEPRHPDAVVDTLGQLVVPTKSEPVEYEGASNKMEKGGRFIVGGVLVNADGIPISESEA